MARVDAIARGAIEGAQRAGELAAAIDRAARPAEWRYWRQRQVSARYLTIYRTLADPAYLDPSIDPDDRPLGSLFAFPDPLDANYGRGGLARTMTARGWLSTWSGLSSHARLADTLPHVKVPTLIVHPTADTEIRIRQALEIRDASGSDDVTYEALPGAPHYLEGHRPRAMDLVSSWIGDPIPEVLIFPTGISTDSGSMSSLDRTTTRFCWQDCVQMARFLSKLVAPQFPRKEQTWIFYRESRRFGGPVMEHKTAAQAGKKLIQCLEREGVEYIFGLSGGAAMPMFDALVDSKIQLDPGAPRAGRHRTWPTATRVRPASPAWFS